MRHFAWWCVLALASVASGQWIDAGGYWINRDTLEIRGESPMGAFDTHMTTGTPMGSGTTFHIPVVSDIVDDMGNVTAANVGTFTLGGASTITGIGGRTNADDDAASSLNGTSQGLSISNALADTIVNSGGWLSGWFRSSVEQTGAAMMMSITDASEDNAGLWVFVTNDAGFGADYRTAEYFLRNTSNTQVTNGTGIQFVAESPLGAFIVVGLEQVSGSTWRFKMWVNGAVDRDDTFTKSGAFTGLDTISFGMLRRGVGDSLHYEGDFHKVSGGTGMPTDAQVRAAYNAARGLTDSDYVSVSPGGIVESTTFDATEATIIPINLTAAARVVPVFVYPDSGGTDSFTASTTFSPTKPGQPRGLSTDDDSEMFGQDFAGKTHMGIAHNGGSYEIDAGYHVLHFHHYADTGTAGTLAKVAANFSFSSDLPVDGQGTTYSGPTNCEYDGDHFWIGSGEIGSDDRYIYKKTAEGVVTSRKLADGIRPNGSSHSGCSVLPLTNGVLAAWIGHNDPYIRCAYFASGDISSAPTATFNVGDATGRFTYGIGFVKSGNNVAFRVRGSPSASPARTNEHAELLLEFDGTDGTSLTTTVIVDTDDGGTEYRMYGIRPEYAVVGGKEIYVLPNNPRPWTGTSAGRSWGVGCTIWNKTDGVVHLPNGDVLNVTNTGYSAGDGTVGNPLVPLQVVEQKVTATAGSRGTLLVSADDYGVDTLHVPGADAVLIDITGGVSALKLFIPFLTADQSPSGGHQTTQWHSLVWNGGLEINQFEPFGGDANTTFTGVAANWKDGTVGGTARILFANSTKIVESGIAGETSGPYFANRFSGGNDIAIYETSSPFADAPFASIGPIKRWRAPDDRFVVNPSIVAGRPNAFAFEMAVNRDRGHDTKSHMARHLLTDTGDTRLVDGAANTIESADGNRRDRGRHLRTR